MPQVGNLLDHPASDNCTLNLYIHNLNKCSVYLRFQVLKAPMSQDIQESFVKPELFNRIWASKS